MKKPKPPKSILADNPTKRLLGVVSPSKFMNQGLRGDEELIEYIKKMQQYGICTRTMSKEEWRVYYRSKRMEALKDGNTTD